jgi:hypothetical protein
LHEAGVNSTFSSYASEAANFGMFIDSRENTQKVELRIRKAAEDLKVRRLGFAECATPGESPTVSLTRSPAARLSRSRLSDPAAYL